MKKFVSIGLMLAVLSLPVPAVVINSFEGAAGNAIDWDSGLSIDDPSLSIYGYDSAVGVTDGSQSLHVTAATWGQTLALRLDYDQRVAFMAHSIFSIDITVPANFPESSSGWTEIYNVTLNAEGYNWQDQFTAPAMQFGFWSGSPAQTKTLTFDYSAYKASMPAVPDWVEIVFATNSDDTHTSLYFDNAQLLVPEPATMVLLGAGALAMIRRKK